MQTVNLVVGILSALTLVIQFARIAMRKPENKEPVNSITIRNRRTDKSVTISTKNITKEQEDRLIEVLHS